MQMLETMLNARDYEKKYAESLIRSTSNIPLGGQGGKTSSNLKNLSVPILNSFNGSCAVVANASTSPALSPTASALAASSGSPFILGSSASSSVAASLIAVTWSIVASSASPLRADRIRSRRSSSWTFRFCADAWMTLAFLRGTK